MNLQELVSLGRAVIFDGAIGTELEALGEQPGAESNITAPAAVLAVQKSYAECGSDVIISNTFSMNPIYMAAHRCDFGVSEVNIKGVEIAREASAGKTLVLGGVGPTGQMLAPLGTCTEEQAFASFKTQAEILAAAGVDGFILETFIDLTELICALRAFLSVSGPPVIVSMSYSTEAGGGRTVMGSSAADCAAAAQREGAFGVGANCGNIPPARMAAIVKTYKNSCSLPILVEPNAGTPRLENNRTVFDMRPTDFVKGVMECIDAGATLLGGCCGTSPAHICALKQAVKEPTAR